MSFPFQCPLCGAEREASLELTGRRVRCPACDQLVEAPAAASASSTEEKALPDAVSPPIEQEPVRALNETIELSSVEEVIVATKISPVADGLTPIVETPAPVEELPAHALPEEEEIESLPEFRRGKEDAEMDMTPMVDIVFQLLIFFMVTASFALQKSLQIPKPTEEGASSAAATQVEEEQEAEPITVHVDQYGTFRIETSDSEEEAPSQQDLIVKLRAARQASASPPTRMLVKAHGDALHERVVMAIDAGPSVGMEQVKLQTVEDGDE